MRLHYAFSKQLFFYILFCGCYFGSIAQNDTQTQNLLNGYAKQMFVDMNNKDYDAILDMTHPKVFEIAPKEDIKAVFKSMFEGNDEFSISIPKEIPLYKVSEVYQDSVQNLNYAFVSYDLTMNMTFNNQEFDEEAKKMMGSVMMAQGMEVDFISNNTLKVLMRDRITILLKDDTTMNKWVMINYDPDSPLFYQVLSTSLIEKAKDYNQNLMLESKKKREN